MRTFDQFRELFPEFYARIKREHETATRPHNGHGLDHDVTVSMLGVMLSSIDERVAQKAFCAGLLHSVDRMVDYHVEGLVAETIHGLSSSLPENYFSPDEVNEICEAARRHGELNQDDQSLTQQALMDADRLANLMPSVVIRSGQFYSDIPAFEFEYLSGQRNPETTYSKPRSSLDDLRNNIAEYVPKLRIPAAQELAGRYVRQLENFINALERSYAELGLQDITL